MVHDENITYGEYIDAVEKLWDESYKNSFEMAKGKA